MTRPAPSTLRAFLASEAAGGVVLIVAAALAVILANSPAANAYDSLLRLKTGPVIAPAMGAMTVHMWIDDGAMALFFLLVGLEIKRALIDGQLARPDRRRLPIVAAVAGMAAPAAIYLAVTRHDPALRAGWAIPAATDIAFAVGVMALLGPRVSPQLKLFLTTVAIADDMGAVAIIAVAYSHGIDLGALAAAAGVLAIMAAMNRRGIATLAPYLIAAALLWLLVLRSGVHATVAGVLAAVFVPIRRSPGAPDAAGSPLHRLEHALGPWVAFVVVPVFGLANAGVSFAGFGVEVLARPLVIGIAAGLFVGKQFGMLAVVAVAERIGIARRPSGVRWVEMYGVTLLAGIGFTMSLFIGGLAFPGDPARMAAIRIGVLAGSILSALAGYGVLRFAAPARRM
ncbi:Na+/H+ antiporter NhaA [Sphingomonas bacterium]|uniref:Na+/H+ antiporter NhaA n=1 Tax=Sphingomonas bacterium TaxID=1895847 RepID=UPI001576774B|nr:Na+/H+ antiporter NhaA [Sphingomonas bacterium]